MQQPSLFMPKLNGNFAAMVIASAARDHMNTTPLHLQIKMLFQGMVQQCFPLK